jgi:translation initiation factor 1A
MGGDSVPIYASTPGGTGMSPLDMPLLPNILIYRPVNGRVIRKGIEMSDNEPLESPDEDVTRVRLPNVKENEMFGIADQLLGASKIKVMCEDGVSRVGRIPGKIKKRMWIREGDLLIISVWDFQPDKCDVKFRYTKTQAVNLSKRNKVPKNLDIF